MRLAGSGLTDWIIQRLTAIYLAVFTIYLVWIGFFCGRMDYERWVAWFHHPAMQVATIVALIAIAWHAWIGLWTVTTDYVKCTVVRLSVQALILATLLAEVIWGILILSNGGAQ